MLRYGPATRWDRLRKERGNSRNHKGTTASKVPFLFSPKTHTPTGASHLSSPGLRLFRIHPQVHRPQLKRHTPLVPPRPPDTAPQDPKAPSSLLPYPPKSQILRAAAHYDTLTEHTPSESVWQQQLKLKLDS
ncbi:hypothetical protein H9L39_03458 [Fusarium oxysporum f. sp. albedinis]|nr:hypothetical protein H9L39_03458 [Fusarium oxysporum f. sp. albedinis]